MQDGGDVLGNLPRSRPGRRSEKREQAGSPGRPRSSRQSPVASRQETTPDPPEPGSDPVGDAVRVAGRAAETGLKVATGVTRELLRRLPRP
jgi:hypothetical protein